MARTDNSLEIVVDLKGADKALAEFSRKLKQRTRIHRLIALELLKIVSRNFDTESNSGTRWAPLKAGGRWRSVSGAKGKKVRFLDKSARILQDTGNLRRSFAEIYSADVAGVGSTNVEYARAHEKGVPKRNLPARPMLPTREQVSSIAVRIYKYEVDRAARLGQSK